MKLLGHLIRFFFLTSTFATKPWELEFKEPRLSAGLNSFQSGLGSSYIESRIQGPFLDELPLPETRELFCSRERLDPETIL